VTDAAVAEQLTIGGDGDLVIVRQLVRQRAASLGFSLVEQTKIVTAASELARNTLIHGGGGVVFVRVVNDGVRTGLRLSFEDEGPGIADVERALTDGWTSGTGLGLGLGGSRRLMHDFELRTEQGKGTQVTITRWR
jgi:serine/threonine-protein kinase RsbT